MYLHEKIILLEIIFKSTDVAQFPTFLKPFTSIFKLKSFSLHFMKCCFISYVNSPSDFNSCILDYILSLWSSLTFQKDRSGYV